MMKTNLNFIRYSLGAILLLGLIFGQSGWLRYSSAENASVTEINQNQSPEPIQKSMGSLPVYFEENRGQHNAQVRYLTRGGASSMFLTATEAVYVLRSPKSKVESQKSDDENNQLQPSNDEPPAEKAVALYMRLAGANPNAEFVGEEQLAHRTNYFKGADAEQWQTGIPNYRRVVAENIYDGVDMVWHGKEAGEIQYDFVVAPNADPNRIEWEIEGAENVSIDADGSLLIETESGVMKQGKPFSFQDTGNLRQEVGSQWSVVSQQTIANQTSFSVRFDVGNYDRAKTLTIDPTVMFSSLAFSTFLGGPETDRGNAIAVGDRGNIFVTGTTNSTTFPTVAGSFDTTHNDNFDVFVSRLNTAGSALIYSTFLGGSQDDEGNGIAVDSMGNAYLTGFTGDGSPDYPTTVGAFDTTHNGNNDVFVTKLNASGSALIYSTFLGGTSLDTGNDIAVDSAGNAYLTGRTLDTSNTDYPTTAGAFDITHNGLVDAFATKLNATGSALIFSTFLGGSDLDEGFGIAVDSAGNAYLTGFTEDGATDYPTTAGAFDTIHNGLFDAFATKLNATGSALTFSTFLGGSEDDTGFGIAVDSMGNAYLTGFTNDDTTDYPTTAGAFDTTHNGGSDAFATKLNVSGSALIYSTFLGGSSGEVGNDIAVDSAGNAYLTGRTGDGSPDYPTTAGAFDITHNGSTDVFATKLNATGSALVSSTFLGGSGLDEGNGIAVDSAGDVHLTGLTLSATDYPTTAGAFDTTHNGFRDAFVTKLNDAPPPTPTPTPTPQGFEADVAARPDGDGSILSDDVVQVRRFLNGSNTPDPLTNEFQRADSSPFETKGDGSLNSADVVQTRRYQNGTSLMQTAGGPMMPGGRPEFVTEEVDKLKAELKSSEDELRQLRVENIMTTAGQTIMVNILVNAVGDEAEYAFTLNYDARVLSKPVIGVGNTTATVRACNTQIGGAINCSVGGFATNNPMSSDAGIGEIAVGENQILITVEFTVVANAPLKATEIKLSKVNAASDAPQLFTLRTTSGKHILRSEYPCEVRDSNQRA